MLKSNCQQISQRGGKKMRIVKFNNLSFTYYHLFVNLSKQIPFGGGIFMKKVFIPNDNTKEEIGKLPPEVLVAYHIVEPARKFGIACDCGNGLGEDGTGLVPFWHNGVLKYKCYKCGKVFDNFDLIAHHFNLRFMFLSKRKRRKFRKTFRLLLRRLSSTSKTFPSPFVAVFL